MTVSSPSASPPVSTATAAVLDSLAHGSDENWSAWQARSAAHDRAERRTLAILASIVASIVVLVAVAILYAFVVR